jgi:hypothetical protein
MKLFKLLHIAVVLLVSNNANAVVVNTLNGVEYEWLELTQTVGMSREQVEAQITDPTSSLYGYEYASRSLMEDLLLSYSSWDGLSGYHGDTTVVLGMSNMLVDFGVTRTHSHGGEYIAETVDGYSVNYETFQQSFGMFGESDECEGLTFSCFTNTIIKYDSQGNETMALQTAWHGFDSSYEAPFLIGTDVEHSHYGSYLVRTSDVPIPAAVWLFGSGLIGLTGIARRKKS